MGKSTKLFGEFPPVTRQEWEDKIKEDLKGAPYEKLLSKTIEGFKIKPFYHSDDTKGLEYLEALPGKFPYNRSGRIQLNDWEIRQDIFVEDITKANQKALHALHWGATGLGFIIPDDLNFSYKNFSALLSGIYFECIHINFITHTQADRIVEYLKTALTEKEIPGSRIIGSVSTDPLGYLGEKGFLHDHEEMEFKRLTVIIRESSRAMPFFKTISLNASLIHNAGGSAVQEVGLALSQVSEYIDQLTSQGLKADEIAPFFQLNFTCGSSYFMEIAKLRATRLLFAHLVKAWGPKEERSTRIYIHSSTSEWNQTVYDPYVNMLRSTTGGMSAALGGADSITVVPFDRAFRRATRFSERIARNTQIILKEEAHLNKVVDPAGGAYYIENLTNSLAEEAWKIFLEIEKEGGYLETLKSGYVQDMVKETARKRDLNIAIRREILLGTNQYPNPTEKIHEDFSAEIAFPGRNAKVSSRVDKFQKYRGSMAFEELRMKVERSEKMPTVFLLGYGNLNWRKARAGFASGFFACAGYKIIDGPGFESVEEGIREATSAKADIIVLCSSDDEYLEMSKSAANYDHGKALMVIAGYPEDRVDEIQKSGIKHFIHVKSNLLEELKAFNSELGIN